jgi:2,3-bisphosphoglycerate-dependent phosphoglycerate mutase
MTSGSDAFSTVSMPTLLLLIRHAEQQTMLRRDADLSDRGLDQARRLADRLGSLPVTAVVASPMRRAQQTAAPLARTLGIEVEVEPDLDEIRMGPQEVRELFCPPTTTSMEPDVANYVAPSMAAIEALPGFTWGLSAGGEAGPELRDRSRSAIKRALARHDGGVIACVTHGGVISALIGSWLGVAADMWFVPWHTGVSVVLFDGRAPVLLSLNDAAHLAADEELLGLVSRALMSGARPNSNH